MARDKIAFDMDGVLCQTENILREEILNHFKFDINPLESYGLNIPGLNSEDITQFVRLTLDKLSPDISPFSDTIKILNKFHKTTGQPTIIITARDKSLSYKTHMWCQQWLETPYQLYFCGPIEKRYLMLYLSVKWYIDDHPETILDICENTSINAYLMDKTYNKDCKLPKNSCRCRNLTEFYNMIF